MLNIIAIALAATCIFYMGRIYEYIKNGYKLSLYYKECAEFIDKAEIIAEEIKKYQRKIKK